MPSPFPGMDAYLESDSWVSFLTQFSVEIARQLAPKLAPKYIVETPQRFVLDSIGLIAADEQTVYPDVGVMHSGNGPAAAPTAILDAPVLMRTAIG